MRHHVPRVHIYYEYPKIRDVHGVDHKTFMDTIKVEFSNETVFKGLWRSAIPSIGRSIRVKVITREWRIRLVMDVRILNRSWNYLSIIESERPG